MFGLSNSEANEQAGPRLFIYVVQRDFWTDEGERIRKGTTKELTAEQAQEGVEWGILKRLADEEVPTEETGQSE